MIENVRFHILGELLYNQVLDKILTKNELTERSKEIDIPLDIMIKLCRVKKLKEMILLSIKH